MTLRESKRVLRGVTMACWWPSKFTGRKVENRTAIMQEANGWLTGRTMNRREIDNQVAEWFRGVPDPPPLPPGAFVETSGTPERDPIRSWEELLIAARRYIASTPCDPEGGPEVDDKARLRLVRDIGRSLKKGVPR